MTLVRPLKDTAEGYEVPLDPSADGLAAKGFYPQNGAENENVGIERDGSGNLVLKDGNAGTKTLTQIVAGASGITEETHKALLHLAHFLEEGPGEGFASGSTKTVTGTVFPTQELWRRADNTKLVERNMTWTGVNLTTDEWKIYAANGTTVLATVTDTIAYSGIFETGRTRAVAL